MSSRATHPIVSPSVGIRTPWGWRDPATGRFTFKPGIPGPSFIVRLAQAPKQQLWRFSYGLTFVEHHDYYGGIIQAWSASRRILEESSQQLVVRIKRAVGSFLGFTDWEEWSFIKADGEGFQQVPYDSQLDGSWEWWVEDDKGVAQENEKGKL